MGGGISLPSTIKSHIAKELREEYEKLSGSGLSDNEIQAKLTILYGTLMASSAPTPQKPSAVPAPTPTKDGAKKSALPAGKPKPGGGKLQSTTRRRSFGSLQKTPSGSIEPNMPAVVPSASSNQADAPTTESSTTSEAPQVLTSQSEVTLPAATAVMDNWDSVHEQPYCTVCKMAFKSQAFLSRHCKYSEMHLNNVKKLEQEGHVATDGAVPALSLTPDVPAASEKNPVVGAAPIDKQEEGIHFKLLYSGTKFYWRTQENFDIHIFHHMLAHAIEVIPYDVQKRVELPRLYLNFDDVKEIKKAEIQQKIDELSTSDSATPNPEGIIDNAVRIAVTTYVLARLQKSADNAGVIFDRQTGDDKQKCPLLASKPANLVPVTVARKRKSSAEEFQHTLANLENDRNALAAATSAAERIAEVMHQGVATFNAKKWWDDFPLPRRRWIWAIRRIIRIKHVIKTTAYLKEIERRQAQRKADAARALVGGNISGK